MRNFLSILAMCVASITLNAQVPSYVPADGLLGWWPFNGNANDESGNGNNGTVNGAILTEDRFGSVNSAYEFDGGSTRINVTQPILPEQESSYTILLWCNFDLFNSSNELICDRSTNSFNYKYRIFVRSDLPNNPVSFNQANGAQIGGIVNGSISTGTWYHVVATADIDLGIINLYIDGELVESTALQPGSIPNQLTGTTFGANYAPGQPGYNQGIEGMMDDIGIWNRVLDACEIRALYNAGAHGVSPTPVSFSGLNSSYSVDDEPSTLVGTPSGGTFIGPGVTGNTFDPSVAGVGTHSVTYTWFDECGGFNTAGLCSTVDQGVGFDGSNMSAGGVTVYPNPSRGQFTVELDLVGLVGIQVFDARGWTVHNEVFTASGSLTQRTLDLSALAKGSYTLLVQHEGQRITQTVVVE